MTKTWLMRRAVRSRRRGTTAPISSSVCRLPFISASTSPARAIATARGRGVAVLRDHHAVGSPDPRLALAPPRGSSPRGPTSTGAIRPRLAASSGPAASRGRRVDHRAAHRRQALAALNSLAKTSPCRSRTSGVARSAYAMRRVGARTVAVPRRSSPSWFTQTQSKTTSASRALLSRSPSPSAVADADLCRGIRGPRTRCACRGPAACP